MTLKVRISVLLFVCLHVLAFAVAGDLPEQPNPPRLVVDNAGILTPAQTQLLEGKLRSYNDSTSTQIVILTMPDIKDYAASDFAQRVAQKWGIGQKGKDNGILILVSMENRDFFIATGYGMEGVVPDAMAKRIFENNIKPYFRAGNYYKGLDEATSIIIQLASGTYKADKQGNDREFPVAAFIIVLIIILIISSISRKGGGGGSRTYTGRGPFIGGGWGSSGRGGGFGGFGGGGFGGGGAGGRW
ncbi:MAG: TPM domain-containing protein [Cytophagaceae bacterium]